MQMQLRGQVRLGLRMTVVFNNMDLAGDLDKSSGGGENMIGVDSKENGREIL